MPTSPCKGCRSGEISRLQWAEVLEDRLRLTTAKTGSRDVVLTPPALAILARRRTGVRSVYVFPASHDAGTHIGTLDVPWRSIREHIGLPREIRLHDLRHTYASQAIMTGETLSMAGQLLGHRRHQTTEIFAHLDAQHLADAADRVSRSISEYLETGSKAAVQIWPVE